VIHAYLLSERGANVSAEPKHSWRKFFLVPFSEQKAAIDKKIEKFRASGNQSQLAEMRDWALAFDRLSMAA
jgi:hypothetical protein